MTLVEMLRNEAEASGLNLSSVVPDESDGGESESSEKNTLEIGDDINLDELTGSDSESDSNTTEKTSSSAPKASTSMAQQRSRRGQSVVVKRNEKGETGLHQACISGNLVQVRRLLDQKHPVNVRDFAGWMPLHEAANHGYVDIVRLLIERGASINDKGGKMCDGVTALHDACGNGCLEVVEVLLEAGANATMRTDLRETPVDTLEKWRARQKLDPVKQNLYDSVHARLVRQIERLGMSRTKVTPLKRSTQPSPIKRRAAHAVRAISNGSSSEDDILSPRPSATTIDAILQDEFATQLNYENEEDDEEDGDNYRCSPIMSPGRDRNPAPDVSEYKTIMETLRTGGAAAKVRDSPLKKLSSSDSSKRRAGMLDTQEVGENWLDQDIVSVRKKPKTLSLSMHRGDSRPNRTTPPKRQHQSKENNHPNRSSPGVSSVNPAFLTSDDECCSIDAFDMMMSTAGNVSSSTVRRRLSNSKPSSSSFKQKNSLLSSGFVRFRSSGQLSETSDNDEHLVSSTLLDADYPTMVPVPLSVPAATPVLPIGSTFKVRVKDQLLNVPVNNDMIGDLTIGWLAEESARRYYK